MKTIRADKFKALMPCMVLLLLARSAALFAQPELVDRKAYPFIDFADNRLIMQDTAHFAALFDKLNHLITVGDNQINIVQIGDSHIQADMFSNAVRDYFQTFFPGGNGGRGFVFPFTVAHTNNPFNYKVSYTGQWESCRNVQKNKDCLLGLAGISVTTHDSLASMSIATVDKYGLYYDYTKVRLFYNDQDTAWNLAIQDTDGKLYMPVKAEDGIATWKFEKPLRKINLVLQKRGKKAGSAFILMGMTLETNDPGVIYHAIGVNGAAVQSFLKCSLLPQQLAALQPDLIVLSLGANDAYGTGIFDSIGFMAEYNKLIDEIEAQNPGVPIIFTAPNDNFLPHGRLNYNNIIAGNAIKAIAAKRGYAVWDLLKVMGGLGSMGTWYSDGMAAKDRVHFSKRGYEVQAGLFFEAFVNAYENYTSAHR